VRARGARRRGSGRHHARGGRRMQRFRRRAGLPARASIGAVRPSRPRCPTRSQRATGTTCRS
jgi:hypothetical protein